MGARVRGVALCSFGAHNGPDGMPLESLLSNGINGMNLADVIAMIESGGNQYAQRFERAHLGEHAELISIIGPANRISIATADVYAAMSHGLFQIMGFRLYGDKSASPRNLGYAGSLWKFLTDADLQREYFALYCARTKIDFTVDQLRADETRRALFAREYNGPGNVAAYSKKLLDTIERMSRV